MFSTAVGETIKNEPSVEKIEKWLEIIYAAKESSDTDAEESSDTDAEESSDTLWDEDEKGYMMKYEMILETDSNTRIDQWYALFTIRYHDISMRF